MAENDSLAWNHDTHVAINDTHVDYNDTHVDANDARINANDANVADNDAYIDDLDTHVVNIDAYVGNRSRHSVASHNGPGRSLIFRKPSALKSSTICASVKCICTCGSVALPL